MGPFSRTALALLAVGATAASGASSARLAARPRAVARMAFGGRQDESRQIGSAAGRGGQYVSKSPQQQQYEAQQRALAQQQLSPRERKLAARRARVNTGGQKDMVLNSNWFASAKGGLVSLSLAAALGGAGWQANRLFKGRQVDLILSFGDAMVYQGDDARGLETTLASYRKQLGPGNYNTRMMARYVAALATQRPVAATTISALRAAMGAMRLGSAEMGEVLLAAADEHLKDKPSVLGKLLFIAERAVSAEAAAPLRAKLPYGQEYVDSLQAMLLEKTFRAAVYDQGGDASGGVPAEASLLGLSGAAAKALMDQFAQEEAEARRKAEAEQDEVAAEENARAALLARVRADTPAPKAAAAGGGSAPSPDTPAEPASGKVLECSNCGYTLFPAAGREFKFFGDDFKCPQCGSSKEAFKDVADEE